MKLLLIRLRLIGDVVFTTPAIRALRRVNPDARISYLVEPAASPVVLHHPLLDEVLVIRKSRGLARLVDDTRWGWQLRRRHYDVVIDFHGGPRSAWLCRATGAPTRLGYAIPGRAGVYTVRVPRVKELRPRHSVQNQWDLLRALDPALDREPDPALEPVEMWASRHAAGLVAGRLAKAGIPPSARLVVLHVSAGNPFRRWPEDSFVTLAASLAAGGHDRRIILTAGPSDREATARVAARARARVGTAGSESIVDLDDVTLDELHALVSRAALYIGGDSGPLHVAATTNAPIVGLYGPTLAERSAPWRDPRFVTESVDAGRLPCRPCDQRACAPGDFRCLTQLPVAAVLEAAERALTSAAVGQESSE